MTVGLDLGLIFVLLCVYWGKIVPGLIFSVLCILHFCVFSHCAGLVISTNAFVSSIAWIDSSAVTCHVLSGVLNCAHWLT